MWENNTKLKIVKWQVKKTEKRIKILLCRNNRFNIRIPELNFTMRIVDKANGWYRKEVGTDTKIKYSNIQRKSRIDITSRQEMREIFNELKHPIAKWSTKRRFDNFS